MKRLVGIYFILSALNLSAQDSLIAQLQGSWILTAIRMDNTLISSEFPQPGPYRWISPNTHWIFKSNGFYEIDYPCCLIRTGTFALRKEEELFMSFGTQRKIDELFTIQFRRDSLILENRLSYGSSYYFVKDSLPVKELNRFTTGYVNPVCLYGTWEIPVGEVSVEFDAINVWYPWKLPETIHVNAKNLHHYWANNRFYLEVDGVKRPFKVEKVSINENDLILIPESWVNETINKQKLERYQVSNVWLRRRNDE